MEENSTTGLQGQPGKVGSDVNRTTSYAVVGGGPSPPAANKTSPPKRRRMYLTVLVPSVILCLCAVGIGILWWANSSYSRQVAGSVSQRFDPVYIPLDGLGGKNANYQELFGASSVVINGPLVANNGITVTPSAQPSRADPGQIYYDTYTDQLAYYNGSKFVFLDQSPQAAVGGVESLAGATGRIAVGAGLNLSASQLENSGVLSLQGQTGNVTLTAGSGIAISGTTVSNSGLLGLVSSSPNILVTDDGKGNFTLTGVGGGTVSSTGGVAGSVPLYMGAQEIGSSIITQSGLTSVAVAGDLNVTGGLTLGSALTVASGGTGATALTQNGVLLGQGSGALTSLVAGGAGLCLVSTGGAPSWGACPGAGGVSSVNGQVGVLTVANASAGGGTITIDNASTTGKGIASFSGTNFVVVGGAVDTVQGISIGATPTFAGVNTNTITPSGNMTVGSTGQALTLQGSGVSVTATSGGFTNSLVFFTPSGSNKTITVPNVSGTLCIQGDSGCGFAIGNTGSYIQNQIASQQSSSNLWISGTARADTSLLSPLLDTATATGLNIGTTNATSISLNQNTTIAAGKSLTVTGGNAASRPASPTEGMVYYDTTTKSLLTYANGKWQADRSTATKIVAASNSSQAVKDAADYVADGTADQVEINAALTAAAGGKVYLAEGTYVANATILVPNNTTLAGAGPGTLIKLAEIDATDNLIENSDATTGTGVVIQDLRLDGQDAVQTGTIDQYGIYFNNMGGGSRQGGTIKNVSVSNFEDDGIRLNDSDNSLVTDSVSSNNRQSGIYVYSSVYVTITNNNLFDNSNYGLNLRTSSYNAIVSNNQAHSNSSTGLFIFSNFITATGNKSYYNGGDGINMYIAGQSSVSGNVASENSGNGFMLQDGDYTTMSGNSAYNNGLSGILVNNNTESAIIDANTSSYNSRHGIEINSLRFVTVSNNNMYYNGGGGAYHGITNSGASNRITDNIIYDSAGTGYAINVQAGATNTYLSNNTYSGTGATSINDAGTNTIYANQLNSAGDLVIQSGNGLSVGKLTASSTISVQGSYVGTALPSPSAPTVTNQGTPGSTSYTYAVSAYDGLGETLISTGTTTTTGNATLNGTNYNRITWTKVGGAVSYKIYRTASSGTPATTGLIGTVAASSATMQLDDTGLAGSGSTSAANTTGGMSLAGGVSAAGVATFRNSVDSTAAFQIQTAAGASLLVADTSNSVIKIGSSASPTLTGASLLAGAAEFGGTLRVGGATNNAQFDGTTYELTFSGTARHARKILLMPEYAGTVLDAGTGANNTGTMVSGLDLTNRRSYYKWTTSQATSQSYDIVVQVPVPSDFSAWASGTPLTIDAITGDTTNGTVQVEVRDTTGSVEAGNNFLDITPTVNDTWQTRTAGAIAGTYTAGDYMTIRIRVYATSAVTNGVKISNIKLDYLSKW